MILYISNKIFAIIVLYNTKCDDSITYNKLKKINNISIIVCDNSTIVNDNKDKVCKDGFVYINMQGNKGLSKAYNKAIEEIKKICGNQIYYVCIFDDDTEINHFFEISKKYIETNMYDVYLPVIKTNQRILSPCNYINNKIYSIESIEKVDLSHISAINSGMIIKSDVFKKIKYNENLFLDYIDHDFMLKVKKNNFKIKIIDDLVLTQHFSMEENTIDSAYNRLKIMNKDLKEFYKKNKLQYYKQIIAYKLVMIKKYRSLKFLFLEKEDKNG